MQEGVGAVEMIDDSAPCTRRGLGICYQTATPDDDEEWLIAPRSREAVGAGQLGQRFALTFAFASSSLTSEN